MKDMEFETTSSTSSMYYKQMSFQKNTNPL